MYLAEIRIDGFRLFGTDEQVFVLPLKAGLNVLVGENDAGKTAVIDAMRLTLGTTSQEYLRVEDDDFHIVGGKRVCDFTIRCKFADLDRETGGSLLEHLSYEDGKACLYVTLHATRNETSSPRRRIMIDVRSGKDGSGPQMDGNTRLLLQATYLRPLRDAERELAAGRNSRLSQILQHTKEIAQHKDEKFEPAEFVKAVRTGQKAEFPKSVANVSLLVDHLIQENEGVKNASTRLDRSYLANLNLGDDTLGNRVSVGNEATADNRIRAVLEKLDLRLCTVGDASGQLPHGLGYNNLLFMACELLLLGQDRDTLPLLLIEEPEAHLHPQLQLRLIDFLQEQAENTDGRQVQVIITTHSPNLASKVKLASMILVCQGRAFPMGPEYTLLSETDYSFLERFLDVTKANLFFARGVLIVEGDAEALLLPTLANLLGRDLTKHGVSIVNVGSRGLRRYARIFRRRPLPDGSPAPIIPIRVACLADRDIRPDCAKEVLKMEDDEKRPPKRKTGPRYESDLPNETARNEWIKARSCGDGENVRTFVSSHWTLEYDLARAGLCRSLWKAVALAQHEARQDSKGGTTTADERAEALRVAKATFLEIESSVETRDDKLEYLACKVYEPFRGNLSKPTTAQHLASLWEVRYGSTGTQEDRDKFPKLVPGYIKKAVKYVTGDDLASDKSQSPADKEDSIGS
jgi:putative ATP-dependent endonuclease of the OLD family